VSETNLRAVLAADMEPGAGATRLPLRTATIPDDDTVAGPTGKVRKFLMRERLLPGTGVS
jgi:hypothetical protein